MSKTTPTARTLKRLRELGYLCQVVEQWIPRQRIRRDLFGIGDVLAAREGERPLLVQCTSGSHVSNRVKKAVELPHVRIVLASFDVEVWGWRLGGAAGARKTWRLTRRPVTLMDLDSLSTTDKGDVSTEDATHAHTDAPAPTHAHAGEQDEQATLQPH